MPRPGIPGLGVGMATLGGYLVYCGIHNVGLITGAREILSGHVPTSGPQSHTTVQWGRSLTAAPSSTGGTSTVAASSSALVNAARQYIGTPYAISGARPGGFDCSGLVNYAANHDAGLPIPGYAPHTFTGATHGPVTGTWYTWSGLVDVPRSSIAPGDLVCWTSHIGICSVGGANPQFIAAPTLGRTVLEEPIYWNPTPRIRRYPSAGVTV